LNPAVQASGADFFPELARTTGRVVDIKKMSEMGAWPDRHVRRDAMDQLKEART